MWKAHTGRLDLVISLIMVEVGLTFEVPFNPLNCISDIEHTEMLTNSCLFISTYACSLRRIELISFELAV